MKDWSVGAIAVWIYLGALLPLDLFYFLLLWSFPPRSADPGIHWAHAGRMAVVGGIAVVLALSLTIKALAKHRDWIK